MSEINWEAEDAKYIWHPAMQMKDNEVFPPVVIDHAKGCYLYDTHGKAYLDIISSWWCNLLGHANPEINAALKQQVDELEQEAHQQRSCAELRVVLTHATYASYAAVDFLQQAARSEQLRVHIRESGAIEALDFVMRQGYHMALLRYAAEDEDYYRRYCQRHGLRQEPIMEFSYLLLTSQDSPLARRQVQNLDELNDYIEVLHGDTHLPGEESTASRWEVNPNRRIHVYERCSQFSILQNLPNAYMWASPMPKRALEQYHLVLRKCPAQRQRMKDVLVYPDRGTLRPEEQTFVQLLHKQAALTVK